MCVSPFAAGYTAKQGKNSQALTGSPGFSPGRQKTRLKGNNMNRLLLTVCCAVVLLAMPICTVALAGEAEDNKKIAEQCGGYARQAGADAGVQERSHCQQATYYRCLLDLLGPKYPNSIKAYKQRITYSCNIQRHMNYHGCKACVGY